MARAGGVERRARARSERAALARRGMARGESLRASAGRVVARRGAGGGHRSGAASLGYGSRAGSPVYGAGSARRRAAAWRQGARDGGGDREEFGVLGTRGAAASERGRVLRKHRNLIQIPLAMPRKLNRPSPPKP